ncbi:MAG: hypothetical protein GY714_00465 [Desulfobacterales bacterium]|nr:hypothetical protein [Desulfobacterales bacterium]MCP4159613.1 hypothetical protein [Deltaproteobacteria bacterium]
MIRLIVIRSKLHDGSKDYYTGKYFHHSLFITVVMVEFLLFLELSQAIYGLSTEDS